MHPKNIIINKAPTTYSTGWFGKPSKRGTAGNSPHTQTHIFKNGKICLCGYKPNQSMLFQWCADGIEYGYLECAKCKEKAKKILTDNLKKKFL